MALNIQVDFTTDKPKYSLVNDLIELKEYLENNVNNYKSGFIATLGVYVNSKTKIGFCVDDKNEDEGNELGDFDDLELEVMDTMTLEALDGIEASQNVSCFNDFILDNYYIIKRPRLIKDIIICDSGVSGTIKLTIL